MRHWVIWKALSRAAHTIDWVILEALWLTTDSPMGDFESFTCELRDRSMHQSVTLEVVRMLRERSMHQSVTSEAVRVSCVNDRCTKL